MCHNTTYGIVLENATLPSAVLGIESESVKMRKILALKFELQSNLGTVDVIAWVDEHGRGKFLEAVKPELTLMTVKAGDTVRHNGTDFYMVKRLKPWRTSEAKDDSDYSEVVCGQDWEAVNP